MTAEAGDIKQLCQMTESKTGKDGQREPCISDVRWHWRVYMGGEVRCVWKKKKKDEAQEEKRRRQAGKWSVGLRTRVENWKMCVRENVMEKEKRETDVTEERGKKWWVKVKYNRIPGKSEMFVTDIRHAWIPSATTFIHCQLLNERQRSPQKHQFLQGSSHPLAFCFSTWLHLQTLPITWARGCISPLIKPGFGAFLLSLLAACSWLQIFFH